MQALHTCRSSGRGRNWWISPLLLSLIQVPGKGFSRRQDDPSSYSNHNCCEIKSTCMMSSFKQSCLTPTCLDLIVFPLCLSECSLNLGQSGIQKSHLRLCIQGFLLILSIVNSQMSPHLPVPLQKGASLTKVGDNVKWCHLDSEQPVPDFPLALTASGPSLPPPQLPDWSLFQVSWF